jgi:colicin import membrane protein
MTEGTDAVDLAAAKARVEALKEDPRAAFHPDYDVGALLADVRALALSEVPDLSTAKGRDRVRSMAAAVSKIKVLIDEAGFGLTEDMRKRKAVIDARRARVKTDFDALRDEVKAPVIRYEQQEAARIASHEAVLRDLDDAASYSPRETSAGIAERIAKLEARNLSKTEMQEFAEEAERLRARAVSNLQQARELIAEREVREAAEAAEREAREKELEQLRREKAEREAADRKAAAEREAAERKAAAAEAAAKAAAEAAEREKRVAAEAAERATREAEERHKRELAETEARLRREAEAREAELARQRADEEARAANVAHREHILREVARAIGVVSGMSAPKSRALADALAAGEIPHATVQF